MRFNSRSWIGSAVFFASLGLSSTAFGEVLWRGDFETGDLSAWNYLQNPTKGERKNITVVESPVQAGKYAAQVVIHPDDLASNGHNRVELKYDAKKTAEGETMFFSFWFRLGQEATVHQDIAYWETNESWRQSLAFYIEPKDGKTHLGFRSNLPQSQTHFDLPLSSGEWHQLAVSVLWSQDPTLGRVSVWLDGTQVASDVVAQTKPDANTNFIQMGFHRNPNPVAAPVDTIFLDEAIEATTLEEILSTPGSTTPDPVVPVPDSGSQPETETPPTQENTGSSGCSIAVLPGAALSGGAGAWLLLAGVGLARRRRTSP